ncbi:diadenosine tetraphosphate (Ap4A) HIT family hydrolase [Arcanobacterium wilhelmae]|uniref:Diadenosine tetraphosphate (Ap4A) HIT family hydrolase n=1 Tax=Arcanobacterium wilhelmae TaxID=1803177 RepID=A0ABT9ND93_9ACTO|nr:HIT family protein [Arcanobacterium wilhelmae]MDP9801689.1 diadenosine tetraphosphate (Ap4A) HIT family hydrolase [Arcanobacterium wilhelmae]WFN91009.1 HIT family protein [Arcanobacterium wilhelmae]
MASIFTKIIRGEIPGQFVWKDAVCVVMATIEPVRPGHVMVIPREEVAKYTDLAPAVFAHLMNVAQIVGRAQEEAFGVERTIVQILGFDVPHTHVHVIPGADSGAAKFDNATAAPAEEIAEAMAKLRTALIRSGHAEFVAEA